MKFLHFTGVNQVMTRHVWYPFYALFTAVSLCLGITTSPLLAEESSSTLKVPGLTDTVEILVDRWGIPHIYAKNQHDLFLPKAITPPVTGSSN